MAHLLYDAKYLFGREDPSDMSEVQLSEHKCSSFGLLYTFCMNPIETFNKLPTRF